MIYDGVDLSGFVQIDYVTRHALPPLTHETTTVVGVDGAWIGDVALEPLEITVGMRIVAPVAGWRTQRQELEDKRRRLAQVLFKRQPAELVLDWPDDIAYMALVTSAGEMSREPLSQVFEVVFYCADPVAYGAKKETYIGRMGEVVIGGNYPTYPIFEVTSATGACVLNVDGTTFQTIGAQSGPDPIIIDCNPDPLIHEASVTKGNEAVAISINSDYFALAPGVHSIACDAPVNVRWTERWI